MDKAEGHTVGRVGGGRVRVGLGGSGIGSSAGRGRAGSRGAIATPEVGAVAGLLAVGVLLGVSRRSGALRAGGNTAVGVVGLVVARAGDVPTLGDAAGVGRFTWSCLSVGSRDWLVIY